ncbi:MAG: hypothetical protein ABIW82_16850 [Dokdonella sp.]
MVVRSASRIEAIQREHRASIAKLARDAAGNGKTLKQLAKLLDINYTTLKGALERRGYQHPRGMALLDVHYCSIFGTGLADTIADLAANSMSRGAISCELNIDAATLQRIADEHGIVFPKTIRKLDPTRIVAAMKSRVPHRNDLVLLTSDGQTHYIAEWARVKGFSATTLRKRLALGWPVHEALNHPVGERRHEIPLTPRARPSVSHPWRAERDAFFAQHNLKDND